MAQNNCQYCGNNPVPHFINWYFESVNVLLTPIRQFLIYNPFSRFVKRIFFDAGLSFFAVKFFKMLGIISYQTNIQNCKVSRAKVLWEEAEKRGIKMTELLLLGKPFDVYIAEKIGESEHRNIGTSEPVNRLIFSGLPRPFGYNNAALDVMDDKAILKKKFLQSNLPVPLGGAAWNFKQALKIYRNVKKPVIVKPRAGSRGRHSSTFVSSEQDLKKAFKIAKQLCFWVMVEEQLMGPVYRATLVNYELCGVLRGDPPQVTGDGISSISQLTEKKNSGGHLGVKDIVIDSQVLVCLLRQNLSPVSVPKQGEIISLSEKIGVNYGGSSSEDFEICHPDNRELFVRAARVAGDPIVGFDFIIPEITRSYKNQKCGFIEANSLPFINLHHNPLLGMPRNVAAKVWDLVRF